MPTVKNTKGIDIIASDSELTKNVYIQVKTNKNKYNFWIVGTPVQGKNVFYAFVNLLADQGNMRPEYYIVPAKDVQTKFDIFDNVKEHESLTAAERKKVLDALKTNNRSLWALVEEFGIAAKAIRKIASDNGIKIKYDRGKGEDFPFCFNVRGYPTSLNTEITGLNYLDRQKNNEVSENRRQVAAADFGWKEDMGNQSHSDKFQRAGGARKH